MALTRLEGWEGRLAAAIEAARHIPYELGRHDCVWLACRSIEALTGIDLWEQWAGRYSTKREALRIILEYDAGGFTAAFSRLFGSKPVSVFRLRRGDIVEYFDHEQHLGVCIGSEVAMFGESGIIFVPLDSCKIGWRMG